MHPSVLSTNVRYYETIPILRYDIMRNPPPHDSSRDRSPRVEAQAMTVTTHCYYARAYPTMGSRIRLSIASWSPATYCDRKLKQLVTAHQDASVFGAFPPMVRRDKGSFNKILRTLAGQPRYVLVVPFMILNPARNLHCSTNTPN